MSVILYHYILSVDASASPEAAETEPLFLIPSLNELQTWLVVGAAACLYLCIIPICCICYYRRRRRIRRREEVELYYKQGEKMQRAELRRRKRSAQRRASNSRRGSKSLTRKSKHASAVSGAFSQYCDLVANAMISETKQGYGISRNMFMQRRSEDATHLTVEDGNFSHTSFKNSPQVSTRRSRYTSAAREKFCSWHGSWYNTLCWYYTHLTREKLQVGIHTNSCCSSREDMIMKAVATTRASVWIGCICLPQNTWPVTGLGIAS